MKLKKLHIVAIVLTTLLILTLLFFYITEGNDASLQSQDDEVALVDIESDLQEADTIDQTSSEEPTKATTEDYKETAPPVTGPVLLDCSDCFFAPVDKNHALPSSYAPVTRSLNLPGGGQLTDAAADQLEALFAAANNDGLNNLYVRSAYRSYQTQQATFEKWVSYELNNGATSRTEAEAIANTYSARPGQSEHQLGTTADILCSGCNFDFNAQNQKIWDWLKLNAEDFGFVMPYPEGREAETGYTYEPWHYRYLGIDKAKQFNQQNLTLNNWLLNQ